MNGDLRSYIHEDDACDRVKKSLRTLRRWRSQGILTGKYENGAWHYLPWDVDSAANTAQARYEARRFVAGSGRGRWLPRGMDWLWP